VELGRIAGGGGGGGGIRCERPAGDALRLVIETRTGIIICITYIPREHAANNRFRGP